MIGYEVIEDKVNAQIIWNGQQYSSCDLLLLELETVESILDSIKLKSAWIREKINLAKSEGCHHDDPYIRRNKATLRMIDAHKITVEAAIRKLKQYRRERTVAEQGRNRLEKQRIKQENLAKAQAYESKCKDSVEHLTQKQIVFRHHFWLVAKEHLPAEEMQKLCQMADNSIIKTVGAEER